MHIQRVISVTTLSVILAATAVSPAGAHENDDPSSIVEEIVPTSVEGKTPDSRSGPDGGVVFETPGSSISLASQPEGGIDISVDSYSLAIGIPQARESFDLDTTSQLPTYDAGNSATVPTVNDSGDLQILSVLDNAGAPEDFEYPLTLPAGSSLVMADNGGALVLDANEAVLFAIAPPWARDASGQSVPTKYEVIGSTLIQHVAHRESDATYPIVADPKFAWAGVLPSVQLTRAETGALRGVGATAAGRATNACRGFVAAAGPAGGVLCGLNTISIMYNANRIYNQGKCAQLIIGPGVISTIAYRGGYCR